jgi:dipeptidase E
VSDRHIVAMSGGGFSMDDPLLDRYVLSLVNTSERPKICFLPTATAAVPVYLRRFFDAFPARMFEPIYLDLFDRAVANVRSFLAEQDVIYVGGGNTANMLAIWRLHGVDDALRAAWEAGVVCCGLSAGANCWFEASTTDSFLQGNADPLLDGLGLIPGSFCPHYDGEPERRPRFRQLIGEGVLPAGIACDDFAAVHIVDREVHEALASTEGAGAYRVRIGADGVEEEAIPMRRLV